MSLHHSIEFANEEQDKKRLQFLHSGLEEAVDEAVDAHYEQDVDCDEDGPRLAGWYPEMRSTTEIIVEITSLHDNPWFHVQEALSLGSTWSGDGSREDDIGLELIGHDEEYVEDGEDSYTVLTCRVRWQFGESDVEYYMAQHAPLEALIPLIGRWKNVDKAIERRLANEATCSC